jgi:cytochrome b561
MFSLTARVLHWLMAVMIVAMIFIGIGMVASVSQRHLWLVRLHKPLGIAILVSAGAYPVMLSESVRLPSIFPVSPGAFAVLRNLHGWLATLLFLTFLGHMAAALHHGLIRRDGVLSSMTVRRTRWQHDQPQVSGGDPASARLPIDWRGETP